MTCFFSLPNELIQHILASPNLTFFDLVRLSGVCHRLRNNATDLGSSESRKRLFMMHQPQVLRHHHKMFISFYIQSQVDSLPHPRVSLRYHRIERLNFISLTRLEHGPPMVLFHPIIADLRKTIDIINHHFLTSPAIVPIMTGFDRPTITAHTDLLVKLNESRSPAFAYPWSDVFISEPPIRNLHLIFHRNCPPSVVPPLGTYIQSGFTIRRQESSELWDPNGIKMSPFLGAIHFYLLRLRAYVGVE